MSTHNGQDGSTIVVGYYDPFGVFPVIQKELLPRFPILKLNWKYSSEKPIKTIHDLPVEFREEYPKRHSIENEPSRPSSDRVYLRLMFVKADNVDVYRGQARPLIKEWLKAFVVGQNAVWGIIYVAAKNSSEKKGNIVRSSVFDKLLLDFEKGKQLKDPELDTVHPVSENILRIKEQYDEDDKRREAYLELFELIKQLILVSFSHKLTSNIRLASLRQGSSHGLNIFATLELANSFADMRFFDEARRYYKQLSDHVSALLSKKALRLDDLDNFTFTFDFSQKSPEEIYDSDTLLMDLFSETAETQSLTARFAVFLKNISLLNSLSHQGKSEKDHLFCQIELLRNLSKFVNAIDREYSGESLVKEWLYTLIDHYLHAKIISKYQSTRSTNEASNQLKFIGEQLSTEIADLILVQRRILNTLAINIGYKLLDLGELLVNISLEDRNSDKYTPSSSKLRESLQNEITFMKSFDDLTSLAIREYVAAARMDTADLLSIDSALHQYELKNYEGAYTILVSAYERFLIEGWSMMGGVILETYLKCAIKLDLCNPTQLLEHYFDLFSLLKKSIATDAQSEVVHNYQSIKTPQECQQLFKEMISLSESLENTYEYPLVDFFSIEVMAGVSYNESEDYFITMNISNEYPVAIAVEKIQIVLANTANEGNTIVFDTEKLTLKANAISCVHLLSTILRSGEYCIQRIILDLAPSIRLSFQEELRTVTFMNDTVLAARPILNRMINKSSPSFAEMTFLLYPNPNAFHIDLINPADVEINVPSLDCVVYSGTQSIKNLQITLYRSSASLKLVESSEPQMISSMDPDSKKSLLFQFPGDRSIAEIQAKCTFEANNKAHELTISDTFDLNLNISIVVNDYFRLNCIYSKFQVSAIESDLPLEVIDCKFTCPSNSYNVKSLFSVFENDNSLIVSGDQPASMFYEISRKDDICNDAFEPENSFDFKLSYKCLRTECERKVLKGLQAELKASGVLKHYYLIAPAVSSLQFCWQTYFLTREILSRNSVEITSLLNSRISKYISTSDFAKLKDILQTVLDSNLRDVEVDLRVQQLYIPVEAPFVDMYHEFRFDYERKVPFIVGQPITSKLIIKSSNKWAKLSPAEILAASSPSKQPKARLFQVQIQEDENWLISGRQSTQFSVADSNALTQMEIALIPINSGEVVLPRVVIESVDDQSLVMSTVFENSLESLFVVPELESLTFSF
ncbi:hypothetical protein PUMCH_002134 [Australozyma saopauloensis]|uniref:Trafficking protein particle complex II-specific subunit 130 n=1 Tax=Australozyma saopauloensis TaxID=291208 RepID=A0AAX4H8U1_9ASCO|nr:hypothetical protein PUMCH_002134 [[Candida] saopauloensis]